MWRVWHLTRGYFLVWIWLHLPLDGSWKSLARHRSSLKFGESEWTKRSWLTCSVYLSPSGHSLQEEFDFFLVPFNVFEEILCQLLDCGWRESLMGFVAMKSRATIYLLTMKTVIFPLSCSVEHENRNFHTKLLEYFSLSFSESKNSKTLFVVMQSRSPKTENFGLFYFWK